MTRVFSRRRLGLFWALLLVGLGAGAGTLQWLGPPAEPIEAAAVAGAASRATNQEVAQETTRETTQETTQEATREATQPADLAAATRASPPVAAAAASEAPVPDPVAAPEARPETRPETRPGATPETRAIATPGATPGAAPFAPPPPPLGLTSVAAISDSAGQPGAMPPGTAQLGAVPAEARIAATDPVIPTPDPEMLERSRHGMVPKLGPDGRTSIRTYARTFDRDADRRPRIGLIIGNIGLFAQHSEEAIARLPGAVTLAFSPYALRPEPLLERARARGMEVLMALPLEPAGFGQDADPGDRALLTSLSAEENLERLDWALSRIQGQVGAIGALGRLRGERFAANTDLLGIIQAALTGRGLLYVDPRPGAPTPARAFGRTVDLVLDDPSETRSEVERRLVELEALAKRNGSALGLLGNPTPFFTAAILAWSAGLDARGGVLVPVTVLLRRPGSQAAPPRESQAAPPRESQAAPPQESQAAPPRGSQAAR